MLIPSVSKGKLVLMAFGYQRAFFHINFLPVSNCFRLCVEVPANNDGPRYPERTSVVLCFHQLNHVSAYIVGAIMTLPSD